MVDEQLTNFKMVATYGGQ